MERSRLVAHDGGEATGYGLFEPLYSSLRRFAAVVADIDMDPDDLVQDALAATLEKHDFAELRQPAAYLKRTILHDVANRRRRAGTLRRLIPRLVGDAARVDNYPSDLAMLDELAPFDRAVVFLVDVEGLSSSEVADQLGLTAAATRKRASRARALLRSLVGATLTPVVPSQEGSQ